jgi:hypothetical protein
LRGHYAAAKELASQIKCYKTQPFQACIYKLNKLNLLYLNGQRVAHHFDLTKVIVFFSEFICSIGMKEFNIAIFKVDPFDGIRCFQ